MGKRRGRYVAPRRFDMLFSGRKSKKKNELTKKKEGARREVTISDAMTPIEN